MKRQIPKERPFEYLRRRDNGQPFSEEIVRNWYFARAYVLDLLKDIAIAPGASESVHVAVCGDSPLMLSVVRQLALSAHFVNYEEYDIFGKLSCRNRTLITVVSSRKDIASELGREEYLNGLLDYCKSIIYGEERNAGSYIDVEIHVESAAPDSCTLCVREEDVRSFLASRKEEELLSIDTRKAVLTSRVYGLGNAIDNLPAEDIHSAKRYLYALDTFQYNLLQTKFRPFVDDKKWSVDQTAVRKRLSNVFCSDCFESRSLGIKRFAGERGISEQEAWEQSNEALSVSEHGRWVVDKLIMGFRPVDDKERLLGDSLFGDKRRDYRKSLQRENAPSHIDICSFRDLRRVDPDSMKYDSLLLLAIPLILEKVR